MKVFLSWSGEYSKNVALILKEWLPLVIQTLEPYVSSEDIRKGSRWGASIGQELEVSNFGILCLTRENINAPWVNFEAGALAKSMDTAFVTPFLFGLKGSDIEPSSPLLQFQYASYTKPELLKLVKDIYAATGSAVLDDQRLTRTFENWWPDLESKFNVLQKREGEFISTPDKGKKETSSGSLPLNGAILEELLNLARTQQKMLSNPEVILPPDYLNYIFSESHGNVHPEAIQDLIRSVESLRNIIIDLDGNREFDNDVLFEKLDSIYRRLSEATDHIENRLSKRIVKGRRKIASVPVKSN